MAAVRTMSTIMPSSTSSSLSNSLTMSTTRPSSTSTTRTWRSYSNMGDIRTMLTTTPTSTSPSKSLSMSTTTTASTSTSRTWKAYPKYFFIMSMLLPFSNMAGVCTRLTTTITSLSTSTTRTWRSYPKCVFTMIMLLSFSNVAMAHPDEAEKLLALKAGFANAKPLDSTWKNGSDPCDVKKKWEFVDCKNDTVRALRLKGLTLGGKFNADAISDLVNLRTLEVATNEFEGPIPEFHLLENLRDLNAGDNKFSGEIPDAFFAMKRTSALRTVNLSGNQFSGKIPESLVSSTQSLKDLQLQKNSFSGPVPSFKQLYLDKCNLSFNQLEGEIPEAMVNKFGKESFSDNPGLCSSKIGKDCPKPPEEKEKGKGVGAIIGVVIGGIIAIVIAVFLLKKRKQRRNDPFGSLGNNLGDYGGMNIHKPMSSMSSFGRTSSISRRGAHLSEQGSGSRKGSSGKSSGELIMVNEERGTFGLPDLMKAAAEVLGNGGLGSAYKAAMANGVSVVVKRMRDMNKLHRDEFYMEMRHLGGLRHKNILPPLAYHYRKEEKLVVSEYVPRGSLLYLMHGDRGSAHAELTWPIRLKILKGVAHGMTFLHTEFSTYELPHGNLKSSNILLSADFEPLLTDYSFHPMFSTSQAAQTLFAYKSPEAVQSETVTPKSDVFCLGIVILEVLTGKFPAQYFNNQKGGTDIVQLVRTMVAQEREHELVDPEIASVGESSLDQIMTLIEVGVDCIKNDHDRRINMEEATSRIGEIRA